MKNKNIPRNMNRRNFLKMSAGGVLFAAAGGGILTALAGSKPTQAAPAPPAGQAAALNPAARPHAYAPRVIRQVTTDGFMSLPGRRIADDNGVFVFGYSNADVNASMGQVILDHKGQVQTPSPILQADVDEDVLWTITNLGFAMRPDLDDAHTVHWHGFRNPVAMFDGVPELSISVPPARDFEYHFRVRDAGTYLYHCHFEDVEHVQMGMDGMIFINPRNQFDIVKYNWAYNDSRTEFDRQYTMLFNEVDTTPHDQLLAVQEFVWSDFKPNYWTINGRSYPDTLITDQELAGTDLNPHQPISSLIQANSGEKILLRMGHLGYLQQAIQLQGIRMTVVGHDATFLGDRIYETNTVYIGPGECRDVIIEAPNYNAALPVYTDGGGRSYNRYWLKNRNYQALLNDDSFGPLTTEEAQMGGMVTQVRVYSNTLDPQDDPNQTFGPSV